MHVNPRFQAEQGAVLVETIIALSVFFSLVIMGLLYGNFINRQAVMESAARASSRALAHFDASNGALPGHAFTTAEYELFASQGIAIATKYLEVAGYNPEDFTVRVTSSIVQAGGGLDGRENLSRQYDEIEVAIANTNRMAIEPLICARSKFKFELPYRLNHYSQNVIEEC